MKLRHLAKYVNNRIVIVVVLIFGICVGVGIGYGIWHSDNGVYERVLVTSVVDGDTIILQDGRHVRYLGIDTPETVHPTKSVERWGIEASDRNKELVENKLVYLQKGDRDIDDYGRLLRYVYTEDGTFVNAELVSEGYARAYIFDTQDWYSQILVQLEQYARSKQAGMWSNP